MKLCLPLWRENFLKNDLFLQGGLQSYITWNMLGDDLDLAHCCGKYPGWVKLALVLSALLLKVGDLLIDSFLIYWDFVSMVRKLNWLKCDLSFDSAY